MKRTACLILVLMAAMPGLAKAEEPVQLVSPAEGAVLDNGRTDRLDDIVWDFDWSDVAGATKYQLYVMHTGSMGPVINRQDLTESDYHHVRNQAYIVYKNRFDWRWKVRANVDGQWGEWSAERSFDVEPVNTDPPPEPWSFVQISDTHAGRSGADTNLNATISQIIELDPLPEFVLVTGDVADRGCNLRSNCPDDFHYDRFLESMKKLVDAGIPYHVVPGNHDRRKWSYLATCNCADDGLCCYSEHFEDRHSFKNEQKSFLFIGLDTGDGNSEGDLSEMTDYYEQLGDDHPTLPKIVFMHHPGVDHWDSDHSVQDEDFLNWCEDNNVQLVLAGHTHESHISDENGNTPSDTTKTIYVQTPSCAVQNPGDDPIGFTVVYVNSPVDPRPHQTTKQNDMMVTSLYSPGNVHMYDSAGGHVGIGASGEVEYGIPGSFYHKHYTVETGDGIEVFPEKIVIFDPTDDYLNEVIGTKEGTYRLDIASVSGGEEITFEAADIPTSPGERHIYAIDWQALSAGGEGVILNIDKNGDGFFEQMAIADNELSYEEFALQTETVVDFDPDTLNLHSEGNFVTVYIELPEDFDVSEIDLFSLALNELIHPLPKPIEIGDYDSDGTNDLMVKFDLQELIAVLEPGEQIIDLTGRLLDGRPIAGFDMIRVIH